MKKHYCSATGYCNFSATGIEYIAIGGRSDDDKELEKFRKKVEKLMNEYDVFKIDYSLNPFPNQLKSKK